MKILQVSTHDHFGGAEAIMQSLDAGYRALGLSATIAFGERHHQSSPGIFLNREELGSWTLRNGIAFSNFVRRQIPLAWKPIYKKTLGIGFSQPWRMIKRAAGLEDFDHPVSRKILDFYRASYGGTSPDLIHFHTFHGDFFDLRQLPILAKQIPIYVTLHDEWMMTGHCGYTLDCERWRTGCGHCPYLDSYPAVARDLTSFNFRRKKAIYRKTKMNIAVPSRWLFDRFKVSLMSENVLNLKHIPNGIDLSVFHPEEKTKARDLLGLPQEGSIFLFAARGGRENRYKDLKTIENALTQLKLKRPAESLMLIVLGERSESLLSLGFSVRFEEVNRNPERMALFYQASDLYLHAANAENYPTVILEAMACGTPVIATAVGGIPEQIEEGVDGYLVAPHDSEAMMRRIDLLLSDKPALKRMGNAAFEKAKRKFDQTEMIQSYLEWFKSRKTNV